MLPPGPYRPSAVCIVEIACVNHVPLDERVIASWPQKRCGGVTNTKPGPPSPSSLCSRVRSRPGIASVAITESPYHDTRTGRPSLPLFAAATAA